MLDLNLFCAKEFYGDLMYKLKKIVGSDNFSVQFIKIISHYKKIGYNIDVLQQTACLVVNPIMVGNFAFLFNCTPAGQTSDYMTDPTLRLIDRRDGWGLMLWLLLGPLRFNCWIFFCPGIRFYVLLSPYLCFISFLHLDLYVLGDNSWIS